MKTTFAKKGSIERKWYLIDAKNQVLGHLATRVADLLRGKNKPIYSPHVDCGDFVVIINAKEVALTGNKEDQKVYYRHSGFPGGLKTIPIAKVRKEKPTDIIRKAVTGMLPHNRLKKDILKKLKLFAGEEHSHSAQTPTKIELK